MMNHRGYAQQGGGPPPGPSFVGYAQVAGGSSVAVSFPAGTQSGDFAFVFATNASSNPGTPAGWSAANNGYVNALFSKVLTSGDISSPPAFTTTTDVIACWVFRGIGTARTVMAATSMPTDGSGNTVITPVANKPVSCLAILVLIGDTQAPTAPLALVGFANAAYDPSAANRSSLANMGYFRMAYDFVPADYGNTGSITLTNCDVLSGTNYVYVIGTA